MLTNGFGWPHVLIILALLVIFFGARRLPDAARGIGRSMRVFRSELRGMNDDDTQNQTGAQQQAGQQQPAQQQILAQPQVVAQPLVPLVQQPQYVTQQQPAAQQQYATPQQPAAQQVPQAQPTVAQPAAGQAQAAHDPQS